MKNKKGFTLTELLVVIVLLVSIAGTTIFGIDEIANNAKEKSLNELIKEIELATDLYINDNSVFSKSLLNGDINEKCTRVYVLQNEGYLDIDLKNPITNERIPGNLCVTSKLNSDGIIIHEFKL